MVNTNIYRVCEKSYVLLIEKASVHSLKGHMFYWFLRWQKLNNFIKVTCVKNYTAPAKLSVISKLSYFLNYLIRGNKWKSYILMSVGLSSSFYVIMLFFFMDTEYRYQFWEVLMIVELMEKCKFVIFLTRYTLHGLWIYEIPNRRLW